MYSTGAPPAPRAAPPPTAPVRTAGRLRCQASLRRQRYLPSRADRRCAWPSARAAAPPRPRAPSRREPAGQLGAPLTSPSRRRMSRPTAVRVQVGNDLCPPNRITERVAHLAQRSTAVHRKRLMMRRGRRRRRRAGARACRHDAAAQGSARKQAPDLPGPRPGGRQLAARRPSPPTTAALNGSHWPPWRRAPAAAMRALRRPRRTGSTAVQASAVR